MSDRRRLELSEVDDWPGELSFSGGEVHGTPGPRIAHTVAPPWRRARDLMHRVFPGALVDTGHTKLVARSRSRSRFIVPVDVNGEFGHYIVLLPNDDGEGDEQSRADYAVRARREWRILAQMTREEALPFRAPQPIALLRDGDAPVLVVSHVHGLDLHEHPMGDALQVAASVAAAIHQLDIDAPGPATRREVAIASIEQLQRAGAKGADG